MLQFSIYNMTYREGHLITLKIPSCRLGWPANIFQHSILYFLCSFKGLFQIDPCFCIYVILIGISDFHIDIFLQRSTFPSLKKAFSHNSDSSFPRSPPSRISYLTLSCAADLTL